jgi:signal transduction histidine kinase
LTIILHDVTEKKINQAKLLEQEKALAILDERERLVRDLHDNLGQVLGFINVQAQAIKRELNVTGLPVVKLERLIEVAQSAHQDMRTYIINVKNTTTRDFIPALKNSIKQFISQSGIDVTLQITGESHMEGLDAAIAEQVLYIIKESLNNIRKHAQARQVLIEITASVSAISVQIKDDGLGFDFMTCQKNPAGFGLNIMQERAQEIDGELAIESSIGRGTTIKLHVPCM